MIGQTAEPDRLLLAGEVDGDLGALSYLIGIAQQESCQAIVQLGGLGYQPRQSRGAAFLASAELLLRSARLPLYFIDGEGDDDNELARSKRWMRGRAVVVSDHLLYLPRSTRFTWGGVRFLAIGGLNPIERIGSEAGLLTSGAEGIGGAADQEAASQRRADVLLIHDCPEQIGTQPLRAGTEDDNSPRGFLDQVIDRFQPQLIAHAHSDRGYDGLYTNSALGFSLRIVGLGAAVAGEGGCRIIDLDEIRSEASE